MQTTPAAQATSAFGLGGSGSAFGGDTSAFSPRPSSATARSPSVAPTTPKATAAVASTTSFTPREQGQISDSEDPAVAGSSTTPTAKPKEPLSPPVEAASSTSPLFKSSQPAPASGPFANLKVSSGGFTRPSEGKGAFGQALDKSSPFYNPPKEIEKKPISTFVSAFSGLPALPATPQVAGSSTSTPVFGSISAMGNRLQSAISPPASSPGSPSLAATTSAFGEYKSSSFAAMARKSSSFKDLLKEGGSETSDLSKPNGEPAASPSAAKPASGSVSVFATGLGAALSEAQEKRDADQNKPSSVGSSTSTPPSEEDLAKSGNLPAASSTSSSFVNVAPPSDEGDTGDNTERAGGQEPDEEKEDEFVLSDGEACDDGGSGSEYLPSEENEEADDEGAEEFTNDEETPQPDQNLSEEEEEAPQVVLRPKTMSPALEAASKVAFSTIPSSTPLPPSKPSTPATPTVLEPVAEEQEPVGNKAHAGSSTPPGSPSSSVAEAKPLAAPVPLSIPNVPVFGLGRPSTRPVRSSPLASAPVSGGDEEEDGNKPDELEATPKQAEVAPSHPLKPVRPKTPPLLGSFTSTSGGSLFPKAPGSAPAIGAASPLSHGKISSSPSPPPTASAPKQQSASPVAPMLPQLVNLPSSAPPKSGPFKLSAPSQMVTAKQPTVLPIAPKPLVEPSVEEGMQAECLFLIESLQRDLEDVCSYIYLFSCAKSDLCQ